MAMGKTDVSQQQAKPKKKEKEALPTKVVVRRLPPSLTEEKLKEELDGMPDYDYLRLVPPDYSLAPHVFSRAYINFKSFENVLQFRNSYDGYIFSDGKGSEYSAVVELAPFQGIPREVKKRKDQKCGTILKDPDYEAFLESLSKKVEPLPSAEVYLEAMESVKADKGSADKTQTPLIEYLNKKRALRNQSRSTLSMLENERRLKREKENSKDFSKSSKSDQKSTAKDSRKERPESGSKSSQDRKTLEIKKREDRKERKSGSGRKSKNESEIRENKETRKDSKRDNDDQPLSARSDSSKLSEERYSKREDRKQRDERRDRDRRKQQQDKEESPSKVEIQKKNPRTETVKEEEKQGRRKSIEYEDPSIVAFGKTVTSTKDSDHFDGKKEKKIDDKNDGETARSKEKSKDYRSRDRNEDSDRRTKNKERPTMAVYRPPVARQDRGKNKDERASTDKNRVKSPESNKSPEKRDRTSDRGYGRDRPRSRAKDGNHDKEADGPKVQKSNEREIERKKDKEFKNKDKDLKKDK